jgi:hypothetical protein
MKATQRLIDSVWTVEFNILNENEVEIIRYSRNDKEGYDNEQTLPQCGIIEDEKRNIVGLLVRDEFDAYNWVNEGNCDKNYKVKNSKHVFSYGA